MQSGIIYELGVMAACAKKDIKVALTDRVFTILGLFLPMNVLILMSLFVLAGSNAPTAVVMGENGAYARQFYTAMSQAHSFRLQQTSAAEAKALINAGKIVAVVSIPANFDQQIQKDQPVQVDVEINNLNTDFTNDIRRAVPLSITSFYAKAFPNLVTVVPSEHDLYISDTDYIPYLGVSILVIALMVGALLQAGLGSAREWEGETMKELLLSPASRWSIMLGKMLGAFLMSLGSVIIVLLVLILVLGVWPVHWGATLGLTLLTLIIFIAVGSILGTLLKRHQPVLALTFGTSIPLFFLSGAFGPITFSTPIVQVLAQIFPVYYGIVVMQYAFHNFALNTYGITENTLILAGYAFVLVILAAIVLRRSTIAH
ncbi:MAG: ABC transporter permease [Anaerolineaceae bacterium]|nr:ABC transporter permease [Anaerolineaceae bacterium]